MSRAKWSAHHGVLYEHGLSAVDALLQSATHLCEKRTRARLDGQPGCDTALLRDHSCVSRWDGPATSEWATTRGVRGCIVDCSFGPRCGDAVVTDPRVRNGSANTRWYADATQLNPGDALRDSVRNGSKCVTTERATG